jgi:TM2 domain-containing membrane protein YozV
MLESEMRGRAKNLTTAYLLWFFLGLLFAHRFYLKRSGGVFLMATLISILLCFVLIGFLFLMILGFLWLADAFRMSDFLQKYNGPLEGQVINEILAARATGAGAPYGARYPGYPAPVAAGYAAQPAYAPVQAPAYQPTAVAPRPVTSGARRLVVNDAGQGSTYDVAPGQSLVVGRGPEANVRLSDARASRQHLTVTLTPAGWLLRDMGATNPARLLESSGGMCELHGETTISAGQVLIGDALITLYPPTMV